MPMVLEAQMYAAYERGFAKHGRIVPDATLKAFLLERERRLIDWIASEKPGGTARRYVISALNRFYLKWARLIEWDWQS